MRRELEDLGDPDGATARKNLRDRRHLENLMLSEARIALLRAKAEERVGRNDAAERHAAASQAVEEATRVCRDVEGRQAAARQAWAPAPWTLSQQQWERLEWQFRNGSAWW